MNIIINVSCVVAIIVGIALIIIQKIDVPEQIHCSGNLDIIMIDDREKIISNLERVFGPVTRHGMYQSVILFNNAKTSVSPIEMLLTIKSITKNCDIFGKIAVEGKNAKGDITFCMDGTLVYLCTNSVVFHFVIPKKNPNIC